MQRIKVGNFVIDTPNCECLKSCEHRGKICKCSHDKKSDITSHYRKRNGASIPCFAATVAERKARELFKPRFEAQPKQNTPLTILLTDKAEKTSFDFSLQRWFSNEIPLLSEAEIPDFEEMLLEMSRDQKYYECAEGPCMRIHLWIPSVDVRPDRDPDIHAYKYPGGLSRDTAGNWGHGDGTPYAPRATPKKRPENWYDFEALAEVEAIGAPLIGPGNPMVPVLKRAAVQAVIDAWHALKYEPTSRQRKSAKTKIKRAKARGGRWGKDGMTYHA